MLNPAPDPTAQNLCISLICKKVTVSINMRKNWKIAHKKGSRLRKPWLIQTDLFLVFLFFFHMIFFYFTVLERRGGGGGLEGGKHLT
jgi:hypothetical protein